KDWTAEERQGLRDRVPQAALRTPFRRTSVLELARAALAIAQSGLERRAFLNAKGEDERSFLDPIAAILDEGLTPADEIMLRYERDWGRRTEPLFSESAFYGGCGSRLPIGARCREPLALPAQERHRPGPRAPAHCLPGNPCRSRRASQ